MYNIQGPYRSSSCKLLTSLSSFWAAWRHFWRSISSWSHLDCRCSIDLWAAFKAFCNNHMITNSYVIMYYTIQSLNVPLMIKSQIYTSPTLLIFPNLKSKMYMVQHKWESVWRKSCDHHHIPVHTVLIIENQYDDHVTIMCPSPHTNQYTHYSLLRINMIIIWSSPYSP